MDIAPPNQITDFIGFYGGARVQGTGTSDNDVFGVYTRCQITVHDLAARTVI